MLSQRKVSPGVWPTSPDAYQTRTKPLENLRIGVIYGLAPARQLERLGGRTNAQQIAAHCLRRLSPDAAASLEEGLEETLTVVRLNVPALLRKTLSTTNPIESAFSVAESVTHRVKRWRDGDMRQRWCVAGLLDAESRFKRVKGHRQIATLIASLEQAVHGSRLDDQRQRA